MYLTGELPYLISRLNQLPTGAADVDDFVNEAKDWQARGFLTSGHVSQIDLTARWKKFQFTQDGADLSTPLL
jgi:hypothetical protein